MSRSLTRKLIESHLVAGEAEAGEEIGISVDQVLLTDTNGTMSWLQFEAMGFPRAVPGRIVSYAVPGQTLLGTDSHTPLCGAAGMLAIGAGGLDVAVALGGGPYFFQMPEIVRVHLTGALQPWVTAKDVILELLRRLTVRGGTGKIFEYAGPGVAALSLPQRMTIANMGAELGLTTSVFPSDAVTRDYFRRLHRKHAWTPQAADEDAEYDEQIALDLSAITPLVE